MDMTREVLYWSERLGASVDFVLISTDGFVQELAVAARARRNCLVCNTGLASDLLPFVQRWNAGLVRLAGLRDGGRVEAGELKRQLRTRHVSAVALDALGCVLTQHGAVSQGRRRCCYCLRANGMPCRNDCLDQLPTCQTHAATM